MNCLFDVLCRISQTLAELQDRLQPFPTDIALQLIEEELGEPASAILSEITPEPVAAASLGQVLYLQLPISWGWRVNVGKRSLKFLYKPDSVLVFTTCQVPCCFLYPETWTFRLGWPSLQCKVTFLETDGLWGVLEPSHRTASSAWLHSHPETICSKDLWWQTR